MNLFHGMMLPLGVDWLGFLQGLFVFFFIAICVFLIMIVLIQKGRGGGLTGALGGSGGNTAFGSKTGDVLTWATSIVFGIFILLAIGLNLISNARASGSAAQVVNVTAPPQPAEPAPAKPAPSTPAPATVPVAPSPAPAHPASAAATQVITHGPASPVVTPATPATKPAAKPAPAMKPVPATKP